MNILLTGGHSGIGLELTKLLLQEGHQLSLIVRSEKRKKDAMEVLGPTANVNFHFADLSNQTEVLRVADELCSRLDALDGIFNNAGVLSDQAYYSPQGNELQFEINALAPYLLTKHLKPVLDKSERSFVVCSATGGMHALRKLDLEDLKKPKKFVKLLGSYRNSKMAMILLMNHLAEQWPKVRICSVDPGPNKTKMTSGTGMPKWLLPFRNLIFAAPTKGAKLLYDGAFSEKFAGQSGVYITGGKIKALKLKLSEPEIEQLLGNITV